MSESTKDDDRGFEAEVEALLRPGNPELFRGVRRETLAIMGLRAPRRVELWQVGCGLAAVAASIALFVAMPEDRTSPAGRALAPAGISEAAFSEFYQSSRGNSVAAPAVPPYGAESTLKLDLAQTGTQAVPAVELGVFEVDEAGRLRRLPLLIKSQTDPNAPRCFHAEGKIAELFGAKAAGKKVLALVVGGPSSRVHTLDGAELSQVESHSELHLQLREIAIISSPLPLD